MGNGRKYLDGFFRWVWRIAGLLVLLLVLYGVASLIWASRAMHRTQAPEGEATIGRLDRPDKQQAALKLGRFEALPGTSVLFARLGSEGPSTSSLSSDFTPTDLRNLLFFDTATRQSHWLLDDNTHAIAALSVVGADDPLDPRRSATEPHALAVLFLSRPADADKIDANWDLRLASADGRRLDTLASDVSTVLDQDLTDAHTLLVFYARHGVIHVMDVDPMTRERRSDRTLPAHN